MLSDDLKEFIACLNQHQVRYLVVGGYAVIYHGYNRTTGDLDVWVEPTNANYQVFVKAMGAFGLPAEAIPVDKFLNTDSYDVFSFGRPPQALEILTKVKGLDFDEAFEGSVLGDFEDYRARIISLPDLIKAKKAAGRFRDLDDLSKLEGG